MSVDICTIIFYECRNEIAIEEVTSKKNLPANTMNKRSRNFTHKRTITQKRNTTNKFNIENSWEVLGFIYSMSCEIEHGWRNLIHNEEFFSRFHHLENQQANIRYAY